MGKALLASVDGDIEAPERAVIGVSDDGLLRGDGVFEVVKLYEGLPFRLRDHLDRLGRSADAIALHFDPSALEREIAAILQRRPDPAGSLRALVTRGGRRILIVEADVEWADSARVALIAAEPATLLTGVKSISYAANMHATRRAGEQGADEAVLISSDDRVLEAPTAAIFWADPEGRLHTPSLAEGILDSITRAVLLEELPVTEGSYPSAALRGASEAFLASTTREIQPVAAIDGVEPAKVDGAAADAARAVLKSAVERELNR